MATYESDGCRWDEGDELPSCSFCGRDITEIALWETAISGTVCCDRQPCRLLLAENACSSEILEIELTEEEDD
jgi:hypothetical protein